MSPRNLDKNKDVIKELEKTISPILVVNNSSLKPYVELFEYAPENIYQQPLGSLVGFFEVKEFSDESAYIVNFLTSVLKKEYYINPKRPVTESLDSALHKVNMALSELAKHGNVEWLGKINAAICVLEKNSAHFSVSGDAKIFLYRSQGLSEISEDLASDSLEPHPLKTFVNVSSGRLEKDDRLLITSNDIFHILSTNEIKKHFQRFEGDKFVQFLKTALSNQIEMIASIVVEMSEPIPAPIVKTVSRKKSSRTANAFSKQTFDKPPTTETLALEQSLDASSEIEAEPEYTDEKTGHIYVQGEVMESQEASHAQMNLYWDLLKEKFSQGSYVTKNEIRKRFSLYKKQLAKKKELRKIEKEKRLLFETEEKKRLEEERVLQEIALEEQHAQEKEIKRIQQEQEDELRRIELEEENKRNQIRLEQEKIEQAELAKNVAMTTKKERTKIVIEQETEEQGGSEEMKETIIPSAQSRFMEKLRLARLEQERNSVINLRSRNDAQQVIDVTEENNAYLQITGNESVENNTKIEKFKAAAIAYAKQIPPLSERTLVTLKTLTGKALLVVRKSTNEGRSLAKFTPHFSKIKELFSRLSIKQKLYAIGALALVFIVPLFIVHFLNKPRNPIATQTQVVIPTQIEILADEKNIKFNTQIQSVSSSQNVVTVLMANNNPTLITKNSIVIIQNNQPKEFVFPSDAGNAISAAYMNDLSLVFVMTDNDKVISFSPISTKFTDNKINLSSISSVDFVGTYLTYLYVLDQKTNQIYRYPRADGGFGEQSNWLKDSTPLAGITDMTIDDNIYAVQNNQVLKFFKGQKQVFTLEASSTPVHFDKIFTTPEMQAIYVLDKENSRIVQYSKDGNITMQYHNEALKDGTSLTVNEITKTAYIGTPTGLISLSL